METAVFVGMPTEQLRRRPRKLKRYEPTCFGSWRPPSPALRFCSGIAVLIKIAPFEGFLRVNPSRIVPRIAALIALNLTPRQSRIPVTAVIRPDYINLERLRCALPPTVAFDRFQVVGSPIDSRSRQYALFGIPFAGPHAEEQT